MTYVHSGYTYPGAQPVDRRRGVGHLRFDIMTIHHASAFHISHRVRDVVLLQYPDRHIALALDTTFHRVVVVRVRSEVWCTTEGTEDTASLLAISSALTQRDWQATYSPM